MFSVGSEVIQVKYHEDDCGSLDMGVMGGNSVLDATTAMHIFNWGKRSGSPAKTAEAGRKHVLVTAKREGTRSESEKARPGEEKTNVIVNHRASRFTRKRMENILSQVITSHRDSGHSVQRQPSLVGGLLGLIAHPPLFSHCGLSFATVFGGSLFSSPWC